MKVATLLALTLSLIGLSTAAHAAQKNDPCLDAAYSFAVKQQHRDYNAREWKKSQPSDPEVALSEEKTRGFELWDVSYGVDEECLEGYQLLMRRSANGKSCAAIKIASDSSRDCG